jgi:hypothetical protein
MAPNLLERRFLIDAESFPKLTLLVLSSTITAWFWGEIEAGLL